MQHFLRRLRSPWPLAGFGLFAVLWLATGWGLMLALGIVLAVVIALGLHLLPGAAANRKAAELVGRLDYTTLQARRARLQNVSARLGGETIALDAITQLDDASRRLVSFVEVLERRFDPNELTFGRYRGAAEQVYLSIIDNLDRLCTHLESVADVDIHKLNSDLRRLRRGTESTQVGASDDATGKALEEQIALHRNQLESAREIMAHNNTALSELTASAAKLAQLDTGRSLSASDAESAVADLVRLADQAGRYENSERS